MRNWGGGGGLSVQNKVEMSDPVYGDTSSLAARERASGYRRSVTHTRAPAAAFRPRRPNSIDYTHTRIDVPPPPELRPRQVLTKSGSRGRPTHSHPASHSERSCAPRRRSAELGDGVRENSMSLGSGVARTQYPASRCSSSSCAESIRNHIRSVRSSPPGGP